MSAPLAIVTATPAIGRARAEAAALAVAAADGPEGGALLLDLDARRPARSTILAGDAARRLATSPTWDPFEATACARGRLAVLSALDDAEGARLLEASADCGLPRVACVRPEAFRALLDSGPAAGAAVLIRAERADAVLVAALSIELRRRRVTHKIWTSPLGLIGARRADAGLDPGGECSTRARRAASALLDRRRDRRRPTIARARGLLAGGESGQALVALVGLLAATAALVLALVAVGGAATAKGRAQRAADLAALSAARSMRDDFGRLFVPARGPDGRPDPRHLPRAEYLRRATQAARDAAQRNGLSPGSLEVGFPERGSIAPLRVEVRARPRISVAGAGGEGEGDRIEVDATAVAEAPAAATEPETFATGGGYSGPLAYRQGQPMRPDVAAAFDRMSRAASGAGHRLLVNSAFRSDAEQAKLFAANPDPRWVAPPGKSLHRCATELDLGPPSAYGWLAAEAGRFGFERRYSWEPWHFGFVDGPAPCSASADRAGRSADGRGSGGSGLPGFVPAFARAPLLAAASRHGVSAALLSAQLLAESNFNPAAVSPAGARGIAQFMPATAAAYGLDDPFDVRAAIDAQARLMADLLDRFGSAPLALAAYNAGPAPVSACGCVPPYPETQGYVARILGLLDGAGQLGAGLGLTLEVRLVE